MLFLATDHRGLKLKNQLKDWLIQKKIKFKDLGAYELDLVDDYPDYAKLISEKVQESEENRGVIFCGSGGGVNIACNKHKGIRCALGFNHQQVKAFTADDHANILAIAADFTDKFKCFQLVKTFLNTEYSQEERHLKRLEKLTIA